MKLIWNDAAFQARLKQMQDYLGTKGVGLVVDNLIDSHYVMRCIFDVGTVEGSRYVLARRKTPNQITWN